MNTHDSCGGLVVSDPIMGETCLKCRMSSLQWWWDENFNKREPEQPIIERTKQ